jgi:pimeloyl-ACP methyl ester carboxylesterase
MFRISVISMPFANLGWIHNSCKNGHQRVGRLITLVWLLLVTSCFLPKLARAKSSSPNHSTPSPARVNLKPCPQPLPNTDGTALCGTYKVFENRAEKSGRTLELNIVVVPALGTTHAADPVFWLEGGPGVPSATRGVGYARNGAFLSGLRKDRDLVFVDQRGTGKSNGLYCDLGDDPTNLQVYYGKLFPLDLVRACREKLERTADLRLYTTAIAMDDLDEIRDALGYSKINLVGGSYGTIAAQVYIRRHPQSVRSAFLVGAATPAIKQPLLFPRAAQHALDLLFLDCAADQTCSGAFPNLEKEFYAVLSRFAHGPLKVSMINPATKKPEQIRLERENYVERIRLMLFTTTNARFVPLVVHKSYQGDFLPFEEIARVNNPGSILARGMYMSVTCSEGVPFISSEEIVSAGRGSFVGETRVSAHIDACKEWPRGDVPRSFIDPVKSDLPVMMFSGQADGSASPEYGAEEVKYLPNGKQILVRYYGHQIDSPCEWQIMRDFIARGSVQGVDTSCTEQIQRPPFSLEIPAQYAL